MSFMPCLFTDTCDAMCKYLLVVRERGGMEGEREKREREREREKRERERERLKESCRHSIRIAGNGE